MVVCQTLLHCIHATSGVSQAFHGGDLPSLALQHRSDASIDAGLDLSFSGCISSGGCHHTGSTSCLGTGDLGSCQAQVVPQVSGQTGPGSGPTSVNWIRKNLHCFQFENDNYKPCTCVPLISMKTGSSSRVSSLVGAFS